MKKNPLIMAVGIVVITKPIERIPIARLKILRLFEIKSRCLGSNERVLFFVLHTSSVLTVVRIINGITEYKNVKTLN